MMSTLVVDGNALVFYNVKFDDSDLEHPTISSVVAYLVRALFLVAPERIVVAWDAGIDPRRREAFPEYKANRVPAVSDHHMQQVAAQRREDMNFLRYRVLPNLGVDQFWATPYGEGDDVIYYIVNVLYPNEEIVILSEDKDLYQLVADSPRRVLLPPRGLFQTDRPQYVDAAVVEAKIGVPPRDYLFSKAIAGDRSDGIPGVHGIGYKTVLKWFKKYGTVEGIVANLDDILKSSARLEGVTRQDFLDTLTRNLYIMTLMYPQGVEMRIGKREGLDGAAAQVDEALRAVASLGVTLFREDFSTTWYGTWGAYLMRASGVRWNH